MIKPSDMTSISSKPIPVFLYLILLIFPVLSLKAQHKISGTIRDYYNQSITLQLLRGDVKIPVDSIKTDGDGHFSFDVTDKMKAGMYLLKIPDGNSFPILFNHENVQLISAGIDENAFVEFVESDENKWWYDYFLLKGLTQYKQDLLKPILQQYPENARFYQLAVQEYDTIQYQLHQKANAIVSSHPQSLAARFIKTDLNPLIDLSLGFDEQRLQLKKHFFDQTDFADTVLIYSDILTRKLIDFLSLHQRPDMSMAEMQLEFIRALDVVLKKSSVDNNMYLFVIEYFIEGFARMGFTGVSDYLSSLPHLNGDCMDIETLIKIERIVGPHRKIVIGSSAPPIQTEDIEDRVFDLSLLQAKKTIVLFWSVTCPHCLELLPQLKKFADEHPDATVVSIVLSPNNSTLKNLIDQEQLNWIHIADGNGWNSPFVESYMVYGTPTLFLLDEEKHILSKPSGIAELKAVYELKQ